MAEIVSFGEWLQKRRKRLEMTRKTLAFNVGCSAVMIKKIERDERRPSLQIAQLLAQHLQIPESEKEDFIRHARGEYVPQRAAPQALPILVDNQPNGVSSAKNHHRLPQQSTPFVGRDDELAALESLLTHASVRLVTIVGAGGMGKTRLAVALSQNLLERNHFSDGVVFVPLAEIDHPKQIVIALAEALHIYLDHSDKQRRTIKQQVLDYLRQKRLLIILDNFEHLLEGVNVVVEILRETGNVQLVVTSREPLQLQEEQVYPIQGLNFPDRVVEDAADYSAIQLFNQSTRRIQPDFTLSVDEFEYLNRLCQLVGGMPLGIELAAGWIDTLSLGEIVAEIEKSSEFLSSQLRNIPDRHRSMWVVFEATWQRLTTDEQAIFSQLAVFRGGFTRKAAQGVTDVSLQMLGRLVGKSMLQYDRQQGRYLIHELLRQFGLGLLQNTTIYEQHATYFCQMLASQLSLLSGNSPKEAVAEIEVDNGNITNAWDWVIAQCKVDILATAAPSLGHYYVLRGHYEAGEQAFRNACQLLPNNPACLIWHSRFLHTLGDVETFVSNLKEALAMLKNDSLSASERLEKGRGLHQLGKIRMRQGNAEKSKTLLEESLTLFRDAGEVLPTANVLISLGNLAHEVSDYAGARDYFHNALHNYQQIGYERGIAIALSRAGQITVQKGDFAAGERLQLESLAIYERLGDKGDLARAQADFALALHFVGKNKDCEALLQSALLTLVVFGDRELLVQTQGRLGIVQLSQGKYEEARQTLTSSLAQARMINWSHMIGLSLEMLGTTDLVLGNYDTARKQLLNALAIFQQKQEHAYVARCCGALSFLFLLAGDDGQAQYYAHKTLQISITMHDSISTCYAFGTAAHLFSNQGQLERAVALHELNLRDWPLYKYNQSIEGQMREPLMAIAKRLAPEIVSDILRQNEKVDFWQAGESLLAEMVALGWDDSVQELS